MTVQINYHKIVIAELSATTLENGLKLFLMLWRTTNLYKGKIRGEVNESDFYASYSGSLMTEIEQGIEYLKSIKYVSTAKRSILCVDKFPSFKIYKPLHFVDKMNQRDIGHIIWDSNGFLVKISRKWDTALYIGFTLKPQAQNPLEVQ